MNDLVLCLGVGNIDNKVSYVHLLRMDDPLSVLTRRSQKDDEFSIGKWYREESGQPRSYKYINNIVPTKVIRHIDINCSGKTTIELVLPVFFAPDLSGMEVFGHTPVMKNQNYLGVPICPFFGLDGNEIISPVKWSYGFCSYSDQLYALKINLSYAVGEPPEWTPQNVGIIKPWNYEEYPFITRFCASSRDEGIVVEQVACPWQNIKSFYCCILMNKNAEISVSILQERRKAVIGECRVYWKFKLNLYDCPVIIAVDCPQVVNDVSEYNKFQLRKVRSDLFELTLRSVDFISNRSTSSQYMLSCLGILMDPFQIISEKFSSKKDDKKLPLQLQIRPNWHLAKWSVAWTVVDIGKEYRPNSNGFIKNESNVFDCTSKDDLPSLSKCFPRIQKKRSIAVLMTVRTVADDAVFLFWDAKTNKFTHRCYAKFFKKISFPFNFGEWFELEYLDIPQNKANIVVLDYTKVEKLVPTRVRDGLCAQFSTNQDRFLNVWHTVYPCSEKNCYYEDMGWWPWLCRKCFPDLCDLVDVGTNEKIDENSTSNNEKNQVSAGEKFIHYILQFRKDKSKVSRLEDYVRKMRESFLFSLDDMRDFENHLSKNNESDKSTSSSPIIIMNDTKGQVNKIPIKTQKRQPVNGSGSFKTNISKMIIAVLMAVKPTGDSVFLLFDKEQGKFTHRVYSDPPKNISGNPQIGKWYKLEHKQYTNTLEIGQKIVISSVIATGNPIATRVKNGILAQFNTKDKFISVWHNNIDKWHNYKASPDGPWWPKLCSMCYSSAVTNLNRITVPSPVTEITEVSNKPWTDKLNGLIYTESENDDSDASINKNPKTNNSTIIAYSPPSTQQRKNSSPKIRPSPISVSGTLFRRTSTCSIDSINILTAPIVPESPTKINMSTELVKQEERKEISDENTEVTSILNDGGFGNARMRRFFTGSSITSSNTSPSIN